MLNSTISKKDYCACRQDTRRCALCSLVAWGHKLLRSPLLPAEPEGVARGLALSLHRIFAHSTSCTLKALAIKDPSCPAFIPGLLCRAGVANIRIVCSAGADGRKKSARQQRKDAADTAQKNVDSAADNVKSGVDQVQDAIENPRSATRDASGTAQKNVDSAADSVKSGINQSQDAIENPRSATRGTSASAQQNIDSTADSLKSGVDQAQSAVENPRGTAADAARSSRGNVDDAADRECLLCWSRPSHCHGPRSCSILLHSAAQAKAPTRLGCRIAKLLRSPGACAALGCSIVKL